MRPISKSGFILGALLAATAAAIKIIFLNDIEERRSTAPFSSHAN